MVQDYKSQRMLIDTTTLNFHQMALNLRETLAVLFVKLYDALNKTNNQITNS